VHGLLGCGASPDPEPAGVQAAPSRAAVAADQGARLTAAATSRDRRPRLWNLELGRKIGDEINAKYLRIGLPEPIIHPIVSGQQLSFLTAGQVIRSASSGTNPWNGLSYSYPALVMPYDGWHWEHQRSSGGWWGYFDDTDQSWCDTFASPPTGPTGFDRTAALIECTTDPYAPPKAIGESITYTLPEDELEATGPIEDYVGQPIERSIDSWPDQPQTRSQIEDRMQAAVDSGDAPMAGEWIAHQLDPQTHSDPTEDDEELTECRPSDQVPSGDPAPTRGSQDFLQDPARWWARYDTVPAAEFPPAAAVPESGLTATGGQAFMRWGWTTLDAEAPSDWEGWGFRKIVAKHGWGPTALTKTEAALLTASTTDGKYANYVLPELYDGRTGLTCEWIVVVQRAPIATDRNPELAQGAPMGGIITAYGRYARTG